MPVDKLGHINIRTPQFAETVAFYEQVLGLRRDDAATMTDQVNNAWLHADDGAPIIHVNTLDAADAWRAPVEPGRLDHVALDCSDQDDIERRLAAAGIPYRTIATRVPGLTQINLLDPNGIKLELTFGHQLVRRQG